MAVTRRGGNRNANNEAGSSRNREKQPVVEQEEEAAVVGTGVTVERRGRTQIHENPERFDGAPPVVTIVGDIPAGYVPPVFSVYPPQYPSQNYASYRPPASAFYPPPLSYTPQPTVYPPQTRPVYVPEYGYGHPHPAPHYTHRTAPQNQRYHPYQAEPQQPYPPPNPPQVPLGYPPAYPHAYPPVQDWYTRLKRNKVPDFFGNVEPQVAELWIRGFEKACRNLSIPEYEWARLAVSMLAGNAENWIEMLEQSRGRITDWQLFRDLFYREYFPPSVQAEKASQFLRCRQGQHMTVSQYSQRFNELGRFYPEIMGNETRKMQQFREGLAYHIREGMGGSKPQSMAELVDLALETETFKSKAYVVVGGKRNFGTSQGTNRTAPQQNLKRTAAPLITSSTVSAPVCPKCKGNHSGECRASASGNPSACYNCGEAGHYSRNCPKKTSRGNQGANRGNAGRPTRVFAIDAEPEEPDDAVVTDDMQVDHVLEDDE